MMLITTYNIKEFDRFSYSLIIGIIYASSDEIHQSFIPGRGPLFTDIIIDTMGVLLGILLIILIQKIHMRIISKKKKKQVITKENANIN